MVKVKICGITNKEDALLAVEAGADALGFNFYSKSPRFIESQKAREIIRLLPPFVTTVGIFVNEKISQIQKVLDETGLHLIQLHGDERPEDCLPWGARAIKAFRGDEIEKISLYPEISAILLDSPHQGDYGGTGRVFDWVRVEYFKKFWKLIILSGGLNPDNIHEAIQKAKPYAVDACSQLEITPGKKDPVKVKLFVKRAKGL